MKSKILARLVVLSLCSVQTSLAADCKLARTPVEKTVCGDAELSRLDARLNQLYGGLMPQLTVKAKAELRAQQRTWLVKRNQACSGGDGKCLRSTYLRRIDDLSALEAESRTTDERLSTVAPPFSLTGTWRAARVHDPVSSKAASAEDLRGSLHEADLPQVGKLVTASPGRVCVEGEDCRFMAWKRTTMAKVEWASALERVLGVNASAQAMVGDTGAKETPGLLLIPQANGTVWAVFSLDKSAIRDSNYAVEVWSPTAGQVGDPTQP